MAPLMPGLLVPLGRPKVLIVDDAPAKLHTLNAILAGEVDVLFATGGVEALEVARAERPDLVLLDVIMPGMDGYQVCQALKDDPETSAIPVIFVTAMGEVDDETKGLELGAIDYIVKPYSAAIVRVRVRNHLELKRHRDALRDLAAYDGLTGIANRRTFDSYLHREWNRSMRAGASLALILLDIDHFKAFNDHYGHAAGDDCLRQVAAALAGGLKRAADVVARFGGEEFACVLPATDTDGAIAMAEQLRERVAGLDIPHVAAGSVGRVTISLGVAAGVPAPDDDPLDLVRMADEMLYRAKRGGRNRVGGPAESAP